MNNPNRFHRRPQVYENLVTPRTGRVDMQKKREIVSHGAVRFRQPVGISNAKLRPKKPSKHFPSSLITSVSYLSDSREFRTPIVTRPSAAAVYIASLHLHRCRLHCCQHCSNECRMLCWLYSRPAFANQDVLVDNELILSSTSCKFRQRFWCRAS
jgi:hypothetical protein